MNKRPEELGIKLRSLEIGSQKLKCPECQPPHNAKDNPLTLTINTEGIVWFCHHCEWRGSYFENGKIPFSLPKKQYERPKKPKLQASYNMYSYFTKRCIPKETLDKFQIFDEKGWFGFQYFNENNELENIKYRTSEKGFKQSKGAKQILYNYNKVANEKTIVFVEGEIDVLSCDVVGYLATTLPNGAPKEAKYNEDDARFKALQNCPLKAKKIIIFTDPDTAGVALHKELLHRFGKDICWYVKIPKDCKDPNDILVKHGKEKLQEIIKNAKPYPVDGLYTTYSYIEQVFDLYLGKYEKPLDIGIEGLNQIYKIIGGTFHVITGIPNHGKSLFLDQILLSMAKNHDWKFAIFSPEHSTPMHIRRLLQMQTGKSFEEGFEQKMTQEEMVSSIELLNEHFFFLETRDAVPSIDYILDVARSAVLKYGVKALIIDPYNEVSAERKSNQREDEHIRDFISTCKRFARTYNIVIWVIAHPTKLPKMTDGAYSPPTAYDISGAAHWHNQADAVLTIFRNFEDNTTQIITRKIREQGLYGQIGKVDFFYNYKTKNFESI